VSRGERVRVEKLPGEVGDTLEFTEVLMVGGDTVAVGSPFVKGAKVSAEIIAQDRYRKVTVFKFKRRKGYRRKAGHRQSYTELKVTDIAV
jgi:large subunit ribosomal protein L21